MKGNTIFTFSQYQEEYLVQLKKRKFPWWIFLLLLIPLILLIKVDQKLEFKISNKINKQGIESANVVLKIKGKGILETKNYTTDKSGAFKVLMGKKPLYKLISSSENNNLYAIAASKNGFEPDSLTANTYKYYKKDVENRVLYLKPLNETEVPNEPQKPKEGCRAFFTGLVVGGEFKDGHISKVYQEDAFSEYVGAGEYPDNEKAFPKSVETTFDGIAIDSGTRVIIYKEKNFKGKILLDKTGPAIINNVIWKNDPRYSHCNTEDYKDDLQKNFPQSVRVWSETDMQTWSFGSLKVICN